MAGWSLSVGCGRIRICLSDVQPTQSNLSINVEVAPHPVDEGSQYASRESHKLQLSRSSTSTPSGGATLQGGQRACVSVFPHDTTPYTTVRAFSQHSSAERPAENVASPAENNTHLRDTYIPTSRHTHRARAVSMRATCKTNRRAATPPLRARPRAKPPVYVCKRAQQTKKKSCYESLSVFDRYFFCLADPYCKRVHSISSTFF